jgi:virulence-associated protein VagC
MPNSCIAKIIQHGRSQTVHLPPAFRLPGDRVRARYIGGGTLLRRSYPTSIRGSPN